MTLGAWLWTITAVFCSAFLIISLKVRKAATSSYAHFVIGAASFPFVLIFFTNLATIMGVGNFVGHASKGYSVGLPHLAFVLGEQGSKIIFALLFAGLAGRLTYKTLSELIDDLLVRDRTTRFMVGAIAAAIVAAWVGGQSKGFGALFHAITGANETAVILFFSVIFIVYTTLGGIYSVVWTDLLQGILVLVFATVFYYYAFEPIEFSLTVLGKAMKEVGAGHLWSFSSVSYWALLAQFVTGVIGILAAQVYWQRCFAARDAKTARNGLLWSGVVSLAMVILTALTGMVIRVLNPELEPSQAVSWFLQNHVPTFAAAIIFALILAAGMSTADSSLNSAATLVVNDMVLPFVKDPEDRWLVRLSIILTAAIGLFAALAAIWAESIIGMFSAAYSVAGGSIVPLLLVGLIWKKNPHEPFRAGIKNSNVTPWGARVGICVGGTLTQVTALGENRILIALAVSAALIVVTSLLTGERGAKSARP